MGKKNIEVATSTVSCYIGMSEYYACFYRVKYGGEPIVFPENHPLRMILDTQLCRNPSLKMMTPHCYSDLAFNYDVKGKVFDIDIAIPDVEAKKNFLAVAMPALVYRNNTPIFTSDNWQLTKVGTERFRSQAKVEFWSDCANFVQECKTRGALWGEEVTLEAALSDFMIHYDIPMEHFENMTRYYRRNKTRMSQAIENKREIMEKTSGRIFYYT